MSEKVQSPPGPLSTRALNGLRDYKYKPGGYTFLDVIHAPLWDGITNRLPMWLAPNLITLTGLIGVIAAYCVNAWYLPNFTGPHGAWLHLLNAVAVVIYVNLDCIDGKQARRTKSSSPLGQLFDHGCDALCVHLLLGNTQVALGSPCGPASSIMQTMLYIPWVLAHLEEYHTGALLYGNGLVGVLEANYALAALSLVSAVTGVQVWDIKLGRLLPMLPVDIGEQYVLRHAFFVVAVIGCSSVVVGQLARLLGFISPAGQLPPSEVGSKQLGRAAMLRHLLMLAVLMVMGAVWMGDDRHLQTGQCRLATSSYGISYALVATQLIMAHMAKEPFTPSAWAFLVVTFGALNSVFQLLPTWPLTMLLAAITLIGYLHYVTDVVQQVCAFLHIKCFTIKNASS